MKLDMNKFRLNYKERVERKYRKKLQNKEFTIITGSCIGGVICHHLGLRFDSPTVNMWFTPHDVLLLASDLDYYLSRELDFSLSPHEDCPNSPAAYLGEGKKAIKLYFNHYKTEEEAREKWNSRKTRIHKDNLFVITTDYELTEEDILLIDKVPCRRIIVFTSKNRRDIPNSFWLKSLKKDKDADLHMVTKNSVTQMWTWEHEFDYVRWLNGDMKFRKMDIWNWLDKGIFNVIRRGT